MGWGKDKEEDLRAFDAKVAKLRPHLNQKEMASRLSCSKSKVKVAVERLNAANSAEAGKTGNANG